jgi:hypothetical protein
LPVQEETGHKHPVLGERGFFAGEKRGMMRIAMNYTYLPNSCIATKKEVAMDNTDDTDKILEL